MRPIQMVDTKTQYLKIKDEIDNGIRQVLDSAAYINGKPVQEFAKNLSIYLGVKHTIPSAIMAICKASVPLAQGIVCFTPR